VLARLNRPIELSGHRRTGVQGLRRGEQGLQVSSPGEPTAVVVGATGTAGKLAEALAAHGAEKIYIAETDRTDFLTPEVDVLTPLVRDRSPLGRVGPRRARVRHEQVGGAPEPQHPRGGLGREADLGPESISR
jgi:electron transfer flavoprotein alpha subunit